MRIFKNKAFNKWASGINLTDRDILNAGHEIASGNYDASLGKKVFKKRIAIRNAGKSGGTRTIVAFQDGGNIFFMYGFAKGKRANISGREKEALQKLAGHYFAYSDKQLRDEIKTGYLFEIKEVEDDG